MSSGELNFESFNFSARKFSDRLVSGVPGHTFDHLRRPHSHKLSALDKAWNGQFEQENLSFRWMRLTLGFIQLFDLQRPIAENRVGADVNGSATRINDQRLLTALRARQKNSDGRRQCDRP